MKQTILSVLLMLLPMVASADAVEIDGIYYNLVDKAKVAEVTNNNPNSYTGTYSGDIVIPSSVVYEGISYSVVSIGSNAFSNSRGLTSVTIPSSVTSIGDNAFDVCDGLTSVHISDIESWFNISFGNSFSNPLYYAHHLYLGINEVKDIVIPQSVSSIGNYIFCGCSGLTSVTIPNSVTSIGESAFYNCI